MVSKPVIKFLQQIQECLASDEVDKALYILKRMREEFKVPEKFASSVPMDLYNEKMLNDLSSYD